MHAFARNYNNKQDKSCNFFLFFLFFCKNQFNKCKQKHNYNYNSKSNKISAISSNAYFFFKVACYTCKKPDHKFSVYPDKNKFKSFFSKN